MSETITIVPTVKAYPALSKRSEENVCVAGIRTGLLEQPRWVRLFPVPFRELEADQQFQKWQEITVDLESSTKDNRPESMRPFNNTIHAGRKLSDRERQALVNSMPHQSMCDIMAQEKIDRTSLGIVRPHQVLDVKVERRDPEEVRLHQQRVDSAAAQQKLFGPALAQLEIIPHRFLYRYLCGHPECGEHQQGIVDWEIGAAYRKWRRRYPTDFIERIRQKWLDDLCGPNRDTRFFVGNMHQHPQSFLVLGVFSPKR